MKEKLHDKIEEEIKQQSRSDSMFTVTAIIINFVILFINWYFASRQDKELSEVIVFIFLVLISLSISIVSIIAITNGKKLNAILFSGISQLYIDEGIEKYYPIERMKNKANKNTFYVFFVGLTGSLAIIMPIILYKS